MRLQPGDRVEITLTTKQKLTGIVLKNDNTTGSGYCYIGVEALLPVHEFATQYIHSEMLTFLDKLTEEELLTHEQQVVRNVILEATNRESKR